MKRTINEHEFIQSFKEWDTYKNHFSINGLRALYTHLTDLEIDLGEDLELDVVAFCCEYTEYNSLEEFQRDYGNDIWDYDKYKTFEDIESKTTLIPVDVEYFAGSAEIKSFIIQVF